MLPNIKNDTESVACQGSKLLMFDVSNNFKTLPPDFASPALGFPLLSAGFASPDEQAASPKAQKAAAKIPIFCIAHDTYLHFNFQNIVCKS